MQDKKIDEKMELCVSETPERGALFSGKIVRNPDVSCRIEEEGYALLFNPDTDNSILIDQSGLIIWKYIEESRSVTEIMEYFKGCFSGSPGEDTVRQDVETYLRNLTPEFTLETA